MKVTVLNNQSLFDLAIRYCGSPLAAFSIALLNSIPISALLNPGTEIIIPDTPLNPDITNYFNSKNHQPATAWNPISENEPPKPEGISYWAINDDFVVTAQITPAP